MIATYMATHPILDECRQGEWRQGLVEYIILPPQYPTETTKEIV
jgi:hypothetical protein